MDYLPAGKVSCPRRGPGSTSFAVGGAGAGRHGVGRGRFGPALGAKSLLAFYAGTARLSAHSEKMALPRLDESSSDFFSNALEPGRREQPVSDSFELLRQLRVHMQKRLYAGNLGRDATAQTLRELFADHGSVAGLKPQRALPHERPGTGGAL